MNVQVAFIVYLLMDLLIYPVINVMVYTKFIPIISEPMESNNSFDYCKGDTASWHIYCVGYDSSNNPGNSKSKLVFKKSGTANKVELATAEMWPLLKEVVVTLNKDHGCIWMGTYRTEDPPNTPPIITEEVGQAHYIDYEFERCTKEHAGEYDCELRDEDSSDFDTSTNGAVTVTLNRICKSDDENENETGNQTNWRRNNRDPTGNNASKLTGYSLILITLVGIVTITMIN